MLVKNRSIKAFYNHKCMQPNPYRIIWDLEMLTEKLTSEEKMKLTHTERLQTHRPCGYCYVIVQIDSSLNYEIISHNLYRGPDALERFVLKIKEELLAIQEDLSALAEMIMAPGDLKAYNKATECWICKGPFLKPAPEVVQKLEEAKHNLLEIKEWESCMEKEHPEKKEAQKRYREALSALNRKVKDYDHINGNYPLLL
ncbi:19272_t:CDS:1 [Funneliformis geosporum]|uniref:19272_t:CDS:1 n=1 Tax=Funneliformis geosporum TaxID=1117311 RepID=A0A9W4X4P9_9GLOM|nr:19272_t:CDS:1 [Funneliformis geosporum]